MNPSASPMATVSRTSIFRRCSPIIARPRQAGDRDRDPAPRPLRRAAHRERSSSPFPGKAGGRRRLDQRRVFRARARRAVLSSMATKRYGSSEPLQRLAAEGQLIRLSPRGILAGDGHASRQESSRGTVVVREGPLEELVMMFGDIYQGRHVLVTGHTGFKGSWLALWLKALGAKVTGIALAAGDRSPPFRPARRSTSIDTSSISATKNCCAIGSARRDPDVVFHMARNHWCGAPTAVRWRPGPPTSWARPTCSTHCRGAERLAAIVVVTTDKCYENNEWDWGYRETDRAGRPRSLQRLQGRQRTCRRELSQIASSARPTRRCWPRRAPAM